MVFCWTVRSWKMMKSVVKFHFLDESKVTDRSYPSVSPWWNTCCFMNLNSQDLISIVNALSLLVYYVNSNNFLSRKCSLINVENNCPKNCQNNFQLKTLHKHIEVNISGEWFLSNWIDKSELAFSTKKKLSSILKK